MAVEVPKRINAIRTATYDVDTIIHRLKLYDPDLEPTIEDVMKIVEEWAVQDLGCSWGHTTELMAIIFQDADTEEEI